MVIRKWWKNLSRRNSKQVTSRKNRGPNLLLEALEDRTVPTRFENPALILVPANAASGAGPANPYPSTIQVTGLDNQFITDVNVSLIGFYHSLTKDVDILLVGPDGRTNALIFSDNGDDSPITPSNRVNLTFDDQAATAIGTNRVTSGTFRISNVNDNFPGADIDDFPNLPTGLGPRSLSLSAFNGLAPNGTWQLFVHDDQGGDLGAIMEGWALDIQARGNVAPVANNDTASTNEDLPVIINVLANDTDADNDPLTPQIVTPPANGFVVINPDKTITYTPAPNFHGTDSFTYRASDGLAVSNVATVSISINPVADPPIAVDDAYITQVNRALQVDAASGVLSNDIDGDFPPGPNSPFVTLFRENFDGLRLRDSDLESNHPNVNQYALFITATLRVHTAGTYTFGINNDDGGRLLIDLNRNGRLFDNDGNPEQSDIVIWDNTDHSALTILSTIGGAPPADRYGIGPVTLAAGDYLFEYVFFENSGESGGEAFYASGIKNAFDSDFRLIGDASQGIGIVEAGVTATTYPSSLGRVMRLTHSATTAGVDVIRRDLLVREGPFSAVYPTADIFNTGDPNPPPGGDGQFNDNHPLPGYIGGTPNADWISLAQAQGDGDLLGWAVDNTTTPTGGRPEFFGWNFLNKNFWINQQGDQARSDYTRGRNTVAVADPDAYDDFIDVDPNRFNAFLITPAISLGGIFSNTVRLEFDSSFRPEASQTATVDVSFDGGSTWSNLLTKVGGSDTAQRNERLVLNVANPLGIDGATVRFRFGLTNAGNNWWWAIDNLEVKGKRGDFSGLTASLASGPSNGTLTLNPDGSFIYVPHADFTGVDTFTYNVSDGTFTDTGTVTIAVNGPNNRAPVARDDGFDEQGQPVYRVVEGQTLSVNITNGVLANDTDADAGNTNGGLTAVLVSGPSLGTLTLNANGSFTYTAPSTELGSPFTETFTYRAFDGIQLSNLATVTITIDPENLAAPVANDDAFTIDEGTTLTVAAPGVLGNDSDADNNDLTAQLVTGPSNGALVFNADGSFTYTPKRNFNGVDSFTYIARDFARQSAPATVTITVNLVDSPPLAQNDNYRINKNQTLNVPAPGVLGNDRDDGRFVTLFQENFEGLTLRPYRTVPYAGRGDGTDWTDLFPAGWTRNNAGVPAPGTLPEFEGWTLQDIDSWSGAAFGDGADSARGLFTRGGAGRRGTVLVADPDEYSNLVGLGDPPFSRYTTFITTPVISLTNILASSVVLEFDSSFVANGQQTATVEVTFNGGATWTTILTLNAANTGVNNASRINQHLVSGDSPFFAAVNNPSGGSMQFRFGLQNAARDWWWAIDNILIQAEEFVAGQQPLTAELVAGPANGSLTLNSDGSFVYVPNTNYVGFDGFTYVARQGATSSNVATVTIFINDPDNLPPVANPDTYFVDEDTPLVVDAANGVLGNDTDPNGHALTAELVRPTINGTLTFNPDGSFTYLPNENFFGSDTFVYRVKDLFTPPGSLPTTLVTITINPVNDGPIAVDDSYQTIQGVPLIVLAPGVLANDQEGGRFRIVLFTEDFEGLPLLPYEAKSEFGGDGSDWLNLQLAQAAGRFLGWTQTLSPFLQDAQQNNPNNPREYTGFTFHDVDSWVQTAGDQNRSQFTRGGVGRRGTVMVVDPDEFDDIPPGILNDGYGATITTAPIPITGVLENSLRLQFDSSWRPEGFDDDDRTNNQTAIIRVSFDGGATFTEVLRWDSNPNGPFFKPDATNEHVVLNLNNPAGANTVLIRFEMERANNDWWWAIDNIVLTGGQREPDTTTLNTTPITPPANGTLVLHADGSFTYTPNPGFAGVDTFVYQLSDGVLTDTATVSILVGTNAPPVSANDTYTLEENTTLTVSAPGILANDYDVDAPSSPVILFREDFEGLPLRPFQSPTESGGDGTDWTNLGFAQAAGRLLGWDMQTGTTPVGNPVEFFGWTFLDIDSWIATEGNQARSNFTRGGVGSRGTIAVADGDAYDDGTDVDPDRFRVLLRTPAISLAGVLPNTLRLEFDSSFRPEASQTGAIDYSFDGVNFVNLLTLTTANSGGNNSLVRVNERLVFDIANPAGAASVIFRWTYVAGNNWWWAIDNILVQGNKNNPGALAARALSNPSNGTLTLNVDGSFTYRPATNFTGTDSFTYVVNDGLTDGNVATVSFNVTPLPTLRVSQFTPTESGVRLNFNRVIDPAVLNLYDQGGQFGVPDLTLVGATVGPVRGSLVLDPDLRGAAFVRTGGPLPADTYTLTLRSAANGFRDDRGGLLDGNADGTTGDDFTATFTVSPASNARVVSVPDFTRGYAQDVTVPNSSVTPGIPLTISDARNVSRVELTLLYNSSLLNVTAFTLNSAITGGTASFNPSTGVLTITAPQAFSTTAGTFELGRFTARVPNTAPYAAKHVLDITDLRVFDTSSAQLPSRADDAVHIAAFFGDTNGSGTYNAPDPGLSGRVVALINSGFAAYQMADPVLIADISNNAVVQANDTQQIQRAVALLNVPNIPSVPTGVSPPPSSGLDPRLYIPRNLSGERGQTVTVPVRVEVTEPAGITIGGFDVAVTYDPAKFSFVPGSLVLGGLVTGAGFTFTPNTETPGVIIVSASSPTGTATIPFGTDGVLFRFDVSIASNASTGASPINLRASFTNPLGTILTALFDNDFQELDLVPDPTNADNDEVDGIINVLGAASPGVLQFDAASYAVVENGVSITITVTRTGGADGTVTVDFATSDGTAVAGQDYTATSGTLTFGPGVVSRTFTVTILDDGLDEDDETVTLTLSNPTGGAILGTPATATLTITDNDATPTLSINDVAVNEGDSGTVNAVFTVTLSAVSGRVVTVEFNTSDVSATAGLDYTATSGTLTFAAGETSKTITVVVLGDVLAEGDETFNVNLLSPVHATLLDGTGVGTILDEPAGVVQLEAATFVVAENAGSITITVTRTGGGEGQVTVDFATSDGTAVAGQDYTATSGTLTFAAGETSKTFNVQVIDDTVAEPNETVNLALSNPGGGVTLGTPATATLTIQDNDGIPSLSIADQSVIEGNAGTVNMVFTVSLSGASSQPVTVNFATADGAALAGVDYNAVSGTLTFNPGELTRTITVEVLGDVIDEPDETFFVNLSNAVNATIADGQAIGTILDDDPTPSLSINDVSVVEGNSGTVTATFTVTLSNPSSRTVTVNFATSDNTAMAPDDYLSVSSALIFEPGVTVRTFDVTVVGDTLDEDDETFRVNLSGAVNATISDGLGIGTIQDDDTAPPPEGLLSIPDVIGLRGTTVTVPVQLLVTQSFSIGSFSLIVTYDAAFFAVSNVRQGNLLDGAGFTLIVNTTIPGAIIATAASPIGTQPPFVPGTFGNLLLFDLTVAVTAPLGTTPLNLLASYSSPNGEVTTTLFTVNSPHPEVALVPPPTNAADDEVDGVFTIAAAATIERVVIDGGSAQRSRVRTITVEFSTQVNVPASGAFVLSGVDANGQPLNATANIQSIQVVNGRTVVVLNFSGSGVEFSSLKDGNWLLQIVASQITDVATGNQLDGDGNGLPGGDRQVRFHRFFGDTDGDRDVDASDARQFFLAFNVPANYRSDLDFDGDGDIDEADRTAFRERQLRRRLP